MVVPLTGTYCSIDADSGVDGENSTFSLTLKSSLSNLNSGVLLPARLFKLLL